MYLGRARSVAATTGKHRPTGAPLVVRLGVFTAAYLSWRPVTTIMFTISDAFFIIGLAYLMVKGRVSVSPLGHFTALVLIGYGVMMAGLFISSAFFDDAGLRFAIVSAQYGFAWVVLPLVICGHDRDYTMSLATSFLLSLVVMEAFGALVYFTLTWSFADMRSTLGLDFLSGTRRLGAFATDANWNGAVAAMAVPFAIYLTSVRRIGSIIGTAAIAILLLGVVLSASFTAFCSVCAALLVFVLTGVIRPPLWSLAVAAALAIVIGNFGLPSQFQKRVGSAVESGDISEAGTYQGRVALIANTWKMLEDHVLVGVGVDQDRVENGLNAPVHNMYLLVWIEGGLLALLGWILIVSSFLAQSLSVFRFDRRAGSLALSVIAMFLTFSVASPHMYARLWAVPVLLALAVAQAARKALPLAPVPQASADRGAYGLVVAA